MARNRIIYASQSVWCNGEVIYRVQSLGSTTTFTSEDIFELGHLDIVDVVDDVPAVAVTLNTNDFGDVRTMAILAQVRKDRIDMDSSANSSNANLEVVDSSGSSISAYYHGVGIPDFAVTCGNLTGVTLWAPVQDECDLGTLADNIEQTLFMDEVYVNSLEFSYTTGANATENYAAETDQKMWLLNDGRFVNFDYVATVTGSQTYFDLTLASGNSVAVLSDGDFAFLRRDANGAPGVTWIDVSNNDAQNITIVSGTGAAADTFVYDMWTMPGTHRIWFPTNTLYLPTAGDRVEVVYAANAYGSGASDKYFEILQDVERPDTLGAVRQGQVEIYIVDPQDTGDTWEDTIAWRLTACTITADMTREPLAELGHLGPYDRPLTLPVPLTVTVDSTAGDLENWAKMSGKLDEFNAGTLDDLDLADLFGKDDLILVVKVYAQTDEEAGGTGYARKVLQGSELLEGPSAYWDAGVRNTYNAGDRERPMKTIVVEHLKITDEGYTLDLGANATQTFGFRSTNDLYVVKGEVDIDHIQGGNKIRRNV